MVCTTRQGLGPKSCALLVLVLLLTAGPALCVTLNATQATYDHESSANHCYASEIDVQVQCQTGSTSDRVTLVQFDLSAIPADAVITQASLRLWQYDSSYMDADDWLKVGAYRLIKSWAEGISGANDGECWNYRDAGTSNAWSGGGARYYWGGPSDRHYANVGGNWVGVPDDVQTCYRIHDPDRPAHWVYWDVTPSAQFWHNNPTKNYGMVLDKWIEGGSYSYDGSEWLYFFSEDYDSIDTYRPKLDVTYYTPGSQTPVTLGFGVLNMNYFDGDSQITFSNDAGRLKCQGTTGNTTWNPDGSLTTGAYNNGFDCDIRVKLEQGIAGVNDGCFSFQMWENSSKFIELGAIGINPQYYEVSGQCAATGNGERHDGSGYWSSYGDAGNPGPPTGSALFFSETPSNEPSVYQTWKIRYDKANQVFCAYVTDGAVSLYYYRMVSYYTGVNFSNWRLAIIHTNDVSGVPTTVYTIFPDPNPPTPNPMTWQTAPRATTTTDIAMTATTASDETPPVGYYFHETTGNPGGSSFGWTQDTPYTDAGLSENTRYGYEVKARDSSEGQNQTAYSTPIAYAYTLMPAPTGVIAWHVTETTADLAATGSFPNRTEGQSGVLFNSPTPGGNGGINEWVQAITDQATGLTPNTQYTFRAKARNGDAIETAWGATQPTVRTLAAQPGALPYRLITSQSIQANWSPNGNPSGTEYLCTETTTGRDSGWITATYWILTGLEPTGSYHFNVVARNADGFVTNPTDLGNVRTNATIGMMKLSQRVGDNVALKNKIVTAVFPSDKTFFIQEWSPLPAISPEYGSGIGVRWPDQSPITVHAGDLVDITGTLIWNGTPMHREVLILPLPVLPIGHVLSLVEPYGSTGRSLGGGDFGCQPGVYDMVAGGPLTPSYGLNVIGTLVKAWGRLDQSAGAGSFAYLVDGSNLDDGIKPGLRVSLVPVGGIAPPIPGRYYSVTGIMRCTATVVEGFNTRELWPRAITDFVPYPEPIGPD